MFIYGHPLNYLGTLTENAKLQNIVKETDELSIHRGIVSEPRDNTQMLDAHVPYIK